MRRLALVRALPRLDTVLVLPNSFSSALLAWATRAPTRLGYRRGGRGWLLTQAVAPPREGGRRVPLAMERYYLDLVVGLGCPDTGTALELFVEEHAARACEALLERHGLRPAFMRRLPKTRDSLRSASITCAGKILRGGY